jgi:hypothetical protein
MFRPSGCMPIWMCGEFRQDLEMIDDELISNYRSIECAQESKQPCGCIFFLKMTVDYNI